MSPEAERKAPIVRRTFRIGFAKVDWVLSSTKHLINLSSSFTFELAVMRYEQELADMLQT